MTLHKTIHPIRGDLDVSTVETRKRIYIRKANALASAIVTGVPIGDIQSDAKKMLDLERQITRNRNIYTWPKP